MPEVEENKTVDIDTSGPSVDVELENDSKETENELEVKNENTKDNNESNDSSEKSSEQLDIQVSEQKEEKEKELEQYSESVQRRIAKLTHKWREAQRQADDAAEFARAQIKLKEEAEKKISKLEPGFMKSTEDSIKSGLEAAKAQLAKAREAGDINAEVEAQALISEYGYKQAKFAETKAAQEDLNASKAKEVKQPEINLNRQRQVDPTPDPKAESWAAKNTWFGQDTAMTYTAFDLHKKLTEQEGYDPSSDEYYSEIDKRIRLEFPHKFDTTNSNKGKFRPNPYKQ